MPDFGMLSTNFLITVCQESAIIRPNAAIRAVVRYLLYSDLNSLDCARSLFESFFFSFLTSFLTCFFTSVCCFFVSFVIFCMLKVLVFAKKICSS